MLVEWLESIDLSTRIYLLRHGDRKGALSGEDASQEEGIE